MIAQMTGTVIDLLEKGVVVEVGGIGYAVFTPVQPPLSDTVTLYTQLIIREDAHELYGFSTADEKKLFGILIGVSGVGPKTALHMLTLYPLTELVRLIKAGDSKAIALVPGIGKKTAEKVVIDLKDKLEQFVASEQGPESDLVEALISLGYKEYQIRSVVGEIDPSVSLQQQITTALRLLGKK